MPNLALASRFWTSLGVETPAAAGAPRMVMQQHSLLHSTIGSIQQQRGSGLAATGYQTDAASGQHDPQAGEQVEEFLELAPRGVLRHSPSEKPAVPSDLSGCSQYLGAKALPLAPLMF